MTSLQLMMQLILFSTVALGLVYFLFYKPTVEAQRRARRVVTDLQIGDEVLTTSGFYARVTAVSEPDDGPAVVNLDLGGASVRARITAIAELVSPEDARRAGNGTTPISNPGARVQMHGGAAPSPSSGEGGAA